MSDERSGAERIADERARQISQEGWTPEHDEQHVDGKLALAAACYAAPVEIFRKIETTNRIYFEDLWPCWWNSGWDKRIEKGTGYAGPERIRELEKAGALIAAEIDRLLRKASR